MLFVHKGIKDCLEIVLEDDELERNDWVKKLIEF